MGWKVVGAILVILAAPSLSHRNTAAAQSPVPSEIGTTSAPQQPAPEAFSAEELRKLLAPYALYPDDLLAQMLPACAYPIEIVQVARWLEKNSEAVAKGDFAALDAQSWTPQVKALARFPEVIFKLNADLDATSDIGDAFVYRPNDVADSIQFLRQEAQRSGALASTRQQVVTTQTQGDASYIAIEPAEPGVIYVPTYDPTLVYDSGYSTIGAGVIGFGAGVVVGAAIDNAWDWGRGWVYPPRWAGYPGYRPGGGDINIGNGNTRPWRPDADRYRPGQDTRPGLANPGQRPGSAGKIGDRNRPDLGQRPDGGQRPGAGGNLPPRADGGRLDSAQRPAANRTAQGQSPRAAERPAQRPNPGAGRPSAPSRPNAFSDVRSGGSAHGNAQRGAASRQSVSRPPVQRSGGGHGGGRPGGGGRGGGRGR